MFFKFKKINNVFRSDADFFMQKLFCVNVHDFLLYVDAVFLPSGFAFTATP